MNKFRCFGEVRLPLEEDTTVVFAERGGGKTALLTALAMGLAAFQRSTSTSPTLDARRDPRARALDGKGRRESVGSCEVAWTAAVGESEFVTWSMKADPASGRCTTNSQPILDALEVPAVAGRCSLGTASIASRAAAASIAGSNASRAAGKPTPPHSPRGSVVRAVRLLPRIHRSGGGLCPPLRLPPTPRPAVRSCPLRSCRSQPRRARVQVHGLVGLMDAQAGAVDETHGCAVRRRSGVVDRGMERPGRPVNPSTAESMGILLNSYNRPPAITTTYKPALLPAPVGERQADQGHGGAVHGRVGDAGAAQVVARAAVQVRRRCSVRLRRIPRASGNRFDAVAK